MIKNVEIEMYGHKWLIEIDHVGTDCYDFDLINEQLNHNGVTLDMTDLIDNYPDLELDISDLVAAKLKQEALNNV